MKKVMLVIAMVLGTASAHALEAPAWACNLAFKGEARGFKVILGDYAYQGKGDLNCVSLSGATAHYPVNVTMKAKPLSPQIAFGRMELTGQAAEIALFDTNPASILGTYYVAQAQGAILGGVGLITATRVDLPTMALKVSLQFAKGFGVNLGLNRMDITLDQDRN
ncbi:hypothetical protein [Bdellovibrio svalbardensis]|uniref:Lipid/polyisoprenoid-binding YceI-like domain-containing protein n=1 Tax=Bdellovibrio svalbardensis TaxID=2972972 RepID=A0ABT6DED6_9BACT|nr:hypothetical protein [Bdellovibrio svalbardensis]MDG0815172.1 hypothetical protein [Bdellovibrio svalbardensis]